MVVQCGIGQETQRKWRICVDFKDINNDCPKYSFPLPKINQLKDATTGHEMMSLWTPIMDTTKSKWLWKRALRTYCYKAMLFGMVNAKVTYQKVINDLFQNQIGKTMEIYVDDILVKSLKAFSHVADLNESFSILVQNGMSLNPAKCAFVVKGRNVLGFMVTQRERPTQKNTSLSQRYNLFVIRALIYTIAIYKDPQSPYLLHNGVNLISKG